MAGLLLTLDKTRVVPVREHRTHPVAGLFNGVGGKMALYKLPKAAMSRVLQEETRLVIPAKESMAPARLESYTFQVYFFATVSERTLEVQS